MSPLRARMPTPISMMRRRYTPLLRAFATMMRASVIIQMITLDACRCCRCRARPRYRRVMREDIDREDHHNESSADAVFDIIAAFCCCSARAPRH